LKRPQVEENPGPSGPERYRHSKYNGLVTKKVIHRLCIKLVENSRKNTIYIIKPK
jgi:hypothetical protein